MKAALRLYVLYGELQPALVAGYGLMLRTVVFIRPPYILHQRYRPHICDEDDYFQYALKKRSPPLEPVRLSRKLLYQIEYPRRHKDKKHYSKSYAEH